MGLRRFLFSWYLEKILFFSGISGIVNEKDGRLNESVKEEAMALNSEPQREDTGEFLWFAQLNIS